MKARLKPVTILIADDDPDDRLMTKEAFEACQYEYDLRFVKDGEELMEYLHRQGPYADASNSPRPGLLLLDLNMPRKDGREALVEIRSVSRFRMIRVIVMTTSSAEQDIIQSYELSAASYITKPVTFDALVDVVKAMGRYWLEFVELPDDADSTGV